MTYDLTDESVWRPPSAHRVYRTIPLAVAYEVDDAIASPHGRFSDGERPVIYFSETADGAVMEYLRRFPEFLHLQDALSIRVFELKVAPSMKTLEARSSDNSALMQFPHERFFSSERDETTRYSECRALAQDVHISEGVGLSTPCAADASNERTNVTLFGRRGETWSTNSCEEIQRPSVQPTHVRLISMA